MSCNFDLVVVGAGPAGYVCAIRAAQLGMRVACVEKRPSLGGTCLNVGCIPSKALLHSSELFEQLKEHGEDMGIRHTGLAVDLRRMMRFKEEAIAGNTKGIAYLFKKAGIQLFTGFASIEATGHVRVGPVEASESGKSMTLVAKHVVIATGSRPATLPNVEIDERNVLSSTGLLSIDRIPGHMVIIGGGVIGVELGAVWSRLGTRITVVEHADRILPTMDRDVSRTMQSAFEKKGWRFITGSSVQRVEVAPEGKQKVCAVTIKKGDDAPLVVESNIVLVSVGRGPCTDGLGLENLDVATQSKGFVCVRPGSYQTTLPGVYAVGDVTGGPMLAHKAMEEGAALAEYLFYQKSRQINLNAIPSVVYTAPEVASVGMTQDEAEARGAPISVGMFPLSANGRAKSIKSTLGFVKIVADKATDRVLGVHIVAPNASEMIHEAAAVIEFEGSSQDVALMCHAHPTFSEAYKEAALSIVSRPVHA